MASVFRKLALKPPPADPAPRRTVGGLDAQQGVPDDPAADPALEQMTSLGGSSSVTSAGPIKNLTPEQLARWNQLLANVGQPGYSLSRIAQESSAIFKEAGIEPRIGNQGFSKGNLIAQVDPKTGIVTYKRGESSLDFALKASAVVGGTFAAGALASVIGSGAGAAGAVGTGGAGAAAVPGAATGGGLLAATPTATGFAGFAAPATSALASGGAAAGAAGAGAAGTGLLAGTPTATGLAPYAAPATSALAGGGGAGVAPAVTAATASRGVSPLLTGAASGLGAIGDIVGRNQDRAANQAQAELNARLTEGGRDPYRDLQSQGATIDYFDRLANTTPVNFTFDEATDPYAKGLNAGLSPTNRTGGYNQSQSARDAYGNARDTALAGGGVAPSALNANGPRYGTLDLTKPPAGPGGAVPVGASPLPTDLTGGVVTRTAPPNIGFSAGSVRMPLDPNAPPVPFGANPNPAPAPMPAPVQPPGAEGGLPPDNFLQTILALAQQGKQGPQGSAGRRASRRLRPAIA